jgi:hypothetical protein
VAWQRLRKATRGEGPYEPPRLSAGEELEEVVLYRRKPTAVSAEMNESGSGGKPVAPHGRRAALGHDRVVGGSQSGGE